MRSEAEATLAAEAEVEPPGSRELETRCAGGGMSSKRRSRK
jgi:hypothetical protein